MPPKGKEKSLQEVVDAVGVYPPEAYLFVQQGLSYTVETIHGGNEDPDANRHVGGKELCIGLRDVALEQWGLLARTVLERWNITSTMDFGRIVFALVEHDLLKKTDEDQIEDFRNVFDFHKELETSYTIPAKVETEKPKREKSKK